MTIPKHSPIKEDDDVIEEIRLLIKEIEKLSFTSFLGTISNEISEIETLFGFMKIEVNRLNTFTGKWPLTFIKPEELAQNGFFYLQSEDKVQCAFCKIIIYDWNVGDKPVKIHTMMNPLCKFLTADTQNAPNNQPKPVMENVSENKSGPTSRITQSQKLQYPRMSNLYSQNVPHFKTKPVVKQTSKCLASPTSRITLSKKPLYPRMSDINNRILSYRDWPLLMFSSRQFAECGLFYTGVGDAVACFYCGVSLGNWELKDDPWVEHEKFSPDCRYLDLAKTQRKPASSFRPVKQNVPNNQSKPVVENVSKNKLSHTSRITLPYKPKYPRMSDIKNRLLSYKNWPLKEFSTRQFAESGLFYTGIRDVVTCFYCGGSIDSWEPNDDPWVEHEKFYPNCGYLDLVRSVRKLALNLIPVNPVSGKNAPDTLSKDVTKNVSKSISRATTKKTLPHKPKYPRMSDINNRILSYRDWPLLMLNSRQLAECGLFYTGEGDAVACFYCGVYLGNWELDDDPWVEHEKFYPECGYLDLVKTRRKPAESFKPLNHVSVKLIILGAFLSARNVSNFMIAPFNMYQYYVLPGEHKLNSAPTKPSSYSESSIPDEIIRQAGEIFSESLAKKVANQHFFKTGKHFTSLHELCDAILKYKELEQITNGMSSINKENKNFHAFMCKVILDEGIYKVFEPSHYSEISLETNTKSPVNDFQKAYADLTKIKDPTETSNDRKSVCKICFDEDINTVFEPCRHRVSCESCAQKFTKCPMCRSVITRKIILFGG